MATLTTLTLGDLIEETLSNLYRETERPITVTLATTLTDSTTSFTLSAGGSSVGPTTVLQFGLELMLVTAKSDDANPTYTVARGYAGTPASAHSIGELGEVSPYWVRNSVRRAILHFFRGPANRHLPSIQSEVMNTSEVDSVDQLLIEVPATVREITSVRWQRTNTGRIYDLGGWRFEDNLPVEISSTGKALRVPSSVTPEDDLIVQYLVHYSWSEDPPTDDSTIEVPVGSEDLAPLYAAAYLTVGRELSRLELDKVEEWNNEHATRNGFNLGLIRQLWQQFFTRVDDAVRLHPVKRHRPFRRYPKP
jgi:hypothetical protein